MKTVVILMMYIALYVLYRIAFPKRQGTEQRNDVPQRKETAPLEVAGKSRFVMPERSKLLQTPAIDANDESTEENAPTFVARNENRDMAIPSERLDNVFGDDPNPEDLNIEPDESETDGGLNEVEELPQTTERDAEVANGLSIEEMAATVDATQNPTEEKAELLYRTEKTDLFEKLVSDDEGKESRIRTIIRRHIQSLNHEIENDVGDNETDDSFDIQIFF